MTEQELDAIFAKAEKAFAKSQTIAGMTKPAWVFAAVAVGAGDEPHPVRAQHEIGFSGFEFLALGIVEMAQHDLFGEGQRASQALAHDV